MCKLGGGFMNVILYTFLFIRNLCNLNKNNSNEKETLSSKEVKEFLDGQWDQLPEGSWKDRSSWVQNRVVELVIFKVVQLWRQNEDWNFESGWLRWRNR